MKYGILIFNALLNFSVSLGRRESSEETNQMFGAQVHRLPYDMGSGMVTFQRQQTTFNFLG